MAPAMPVSMMAPPSENIFALTPQSFGLGLRAPHYDAILAAPPALDFFEIISENFMQAHEGYWEFLGDLRHRYQFIMHGVGLSIGGTDPLDDNYLVRLKRLADFLRPAHISDHLCFTGLGGHNTHDLLPLPLTSESLAHVADRVKAVQDCLGRPLVLENPSSYLAFTQSTIPEAEFLAELTRRTGCGLLLDINNVYVSAFNHGWDAAAYLAALPPERIAYLHLAGHRHCGTHIIATHDDHIGEPVWALYADCIARVGARPTMIEWDEQIPDFAIVMQELARARAVSQEVADAPLRHRA